MIFDKKGDLFQLSVCYYWYSIVKNSVFVLVPSAKVQATEATSRKMSTSSKSPNASLKRWRLPPFVGSIDNLKIRNTARFLNVYLFEEPLLFLEMEDGHEWYESRAFSVRKWSKMWPFKLWGASHLWSRGSQGVSVFHQISLFSAISTCKCLTQDYHRKGTSISRHSTRLQSPC